jgi:hypothetical protein
MLNKEPSPEISIVSPFVKTYVPPPEANISTRATIGADSQNAMASSPGIAPSIHSDGRSITASSVRRQYLERELRAVQEKIIDINDLERHNYPISGAAPISRSGRILRLFSTHGSWMQPSSQQVPRSELDAARQRNEELLARIQDLERQMESAWALGLSDDPPPGYSD